MTGFPCLEKIKTVKESSGHVGKTQQRAKRASFSGLALLRVRRDHGNGLWTLEGDDGQLYLAVKGKKFKPLDRPPQWATAEDVEVMRELGIKVRPGSAL